MPTETHIPAAAAPTPAGPPGGATAVDPKAAVPDTVQPDPNNPEPSPIGLTQVQQLTRHIEKRRTGGKPVAPGFHIVHLLGEGTFGNVWLARDEQSGMMVAIKFFARQTGQQWQMLQDEVKQLVTLDGIHGIVQLKDVAADADPPYFVMSYAPNGSLADRLVTGSMPISDAVAVFTGIVRTLAIVHAKGILHCDLKPGNVLIDPMGQPLIADFGQAHLASDASPALGTFFYMAPEQADLAHQSPDTRWDVYALGALFYALLTGEPPRKNPDLCDALEQTVELSRRLRVYREGIPKAPKPVEHRRLRGMDRALADVLDRCLEIDPARRLRDAGAVLDALRRREVRRRQRPIVLTVAIAAISFLTMMGLFGRYQAERSYRRTRDEFTNRIATAAGDPAGHTARRVAEQLETDLRHRIELLDLWSRDGLAELIVACPRAKLEYADARLRRLEDWVRSKARADDARDDVFSTVSVVDADGHFLTRIDSLGAAPSRAEWQDNYHRSFAWRDWFSGQGHQFDRKTEPHRPITGPHVSEPYFGQGLNKGKRLFNISVPVKAGDAVTGLLVGHIYTEKYYGWVKRMRDLQDGFAVVVNDRGHCLCHPEEDLIEPQPERPMEVFYPVDSPLLTGAEDSGILHEFNDPVKPGGEFVADFARFQPYANHPDRKWLVVIKYPLGPLAALRDNLWSVVRDLILASGVFIAVGGVGLWWLLRREERLARA